MWTAILAVLAVVLIPTACVLWFMSEAVSNERLAVRQKLVEVYRGELIRKQMETDQRLEEGMRMLEAAAAMAPAEAYERVISQGGSIQGAVVFDQAGHVVYPVMEVRVDRGAEPPEWRAGRQLEEAGEYAGAAEAYGKAALAESPDWKAEALRARGRCLAKAGRRAEALQLLGIDVAREGFRAARDEHGRLIAPDAQFLALRMMSDNRPDEKALRERVGRDLLARLTTHRGIVMPAGQRLFLLREGEAWWRELAAKPELVARWITAEQMAHGYLEAELGQPDAQGGRSTKVQGVWTLTAADKRVVGLWKGIATGRTSEAGADAEYAIEWDGTRREGEEPLLSMAAGRHVPELNRAVYLTGDAFKTAATRQEAAYLWTGGVGIAAIAVLGAGMGFFLRRQARVTRLKNDLIATVSHELKTPLSSMRVLVDTLLEGRCTSASQEREYLAMLARENMRLSRLIDNFLTFSRMERNRKTFTFARQNVREITQAAVDAMGDRGERVTVNVPPDLDDVRADADALVTAVMNLLDNACKYSGERTPIELRAFADGQDVCIAVKDQGIGIAPRHRQRIFDRFYQVDQSLSRTTGGCGLGLSIVRFIVDAHGGKMQVESQVGKGSTFTVRLPRLERSSVSEGVGDGR